MPRHLIDLVINDSISAEALTDLISKAVEDLGLLDPVSVRASENIGFHAEKALVVDNDNPNDPTILPLSGARLEIGEWSTHEDSEYELEFVASTAFRFDT